MSTPESDFFGHHPAGGYDYCRRCGADVHASNHHRHWAWHGKTDSNRSINLHGGDCAWDNPDKPRQNTDAQTPGLVGYGVIN